MKAPDRKCLYCQNPIQGRSDKIYCNVYCKSALQYQKSKQGKSEYSRIDRVLKHNRQILKKYNKAGKSIIRRADLVNQGFNPNYFTHYWKSKAGKVYLFCYEFGFLEIEQKGVKKYLLIQHQEYMKNKSAEELKNQFTFLDPNNYL